jgi:two-component system CheB/CheR fusion protein
MSSSVANPFPVVGVGASAGGLTPLKQLVSGIPSQAGLALVVVQHLDPHAESHLATLLQAHTEMQVENVTHGMAVVPDHVYVIQPNTNVALVDGVFSVTPRPDDRRPYYPVDHFLRSLAMVQGPHAVGVILSGTGSDGTLGICEVKAAGGVTFAQNSQSAQHPGMPASAAASGAVDLVLPPQEIATRLAALPQHPFLSGRIALEQAVDDRDQFQRVIAALRTSTGVDFSQYRDTTIKRRTARRMLLRGFQSPAEYAKFLESDRGEAEALYRDVLINVTSFFRDPEMFEALKRNVLPEIIQAAPEGQPLRMWVPGCSAGQEAYSLAIVALESLNGRSVKPPIQVFATDLGDEASLERARSGVYPESIEAEVTPERLRRFFTKDGPNYRVQKSLRDMCVFARQNVTVDPPFSRVDVISCRNVLMYMSAALQERLFPVFHFALNRNGILILGTAETVGRFSDLFTVVDRAHKIYRRQESSRRPSLTFMTGEWFPRASTRSSDDRFHAPTDFQREADRITLGRYAPPSVLVDQNYEIQQFRGRTAPFLETPAGQPTRSLLRMIKEGLLMEMRSALAEVKSTKAPVIRERLHVSDGGRDLEFTLRVLPVTAPHSSDFRLLVLFETTEWPAGLAVRVPDDASLGHRDVAWLRRARLHKAVPAIHRR